MKLVDKFTDYIFESRVEDLEDIIDKKGGLKLHQQAVNTEDLEERDDLTFYLLVFVMEISYKIGFRDGLQFLSEIITSREG